jgi:hypothetical protein
MDLVRGSCGKLSRNQAPGYISAIVRFEPGKLYVITRSFLNRGKHYFDHIMCMHLFNNLSAVKIEVGLHFMGYKLTVDNHVILTKWYGSWVHPTSAVFLFKGFIWGGL